MSTHSNWWPFAVFQKRMHRSAVPPPDARRPLWWGDQAMALTAAVCSVSLNVGCWECWFHTKSYWFPTKKDVLLPWSDQRKRILCRIWISLFTIYIYLIVISSGGKLSVIIWPFKPTNLQILLQELISFIPIVVRNINGLQERISILTSDLWPTSLFTNSLETRRSCWRMLRSLLPDARIREFHAKTPVLVWCPPIVLTFLHWLPSHIYSLHWKNRKKITFLSWNMSELKKLQSLSSIVYLNLTEICTNWYVGTLSGPLDWAHTIIGSQIT